MTYWTYPDVWMRGLHNFEPATKETGGNRNVVFMENATNLMDYKGIKWNSINVMRSWHYKITYK